MVTDCSKLSLTSKTANHTTKRHIILVYFHTYGQPKCMLYGIINCCNVFINKMMEDVNERHERVLLRPWLEIMLETSSIPGLDWFDKERMMFKVPWKHRSKKDWSIRHSSVFLVSKL